MRESGYKNTGMGMTTTVATAPTDQAEPMPFLPGGFAGEALSGHDRSKLKAAFDYFNQMSEQLTGAYQGLEKQVKQLTQELEQTRRQHQAEVQDKERVTGRLENLLNILPVGVVLLDVRGVVQETNTAALDLLGEPLEGELWLDIIERCFAPRLDDGHEISLKDGRRVNIATRSLEVEPGQLIVLTDMTQNRVMQERISHMQRLSALGRMVASLAHQIRTPLSAAMLYGEHLAGGELDSDQQQRFAGKLMSRLQHLEQQVRDMLIFAQGDMPVNDRITSRDLVTGIESAMETVLASHALQCDITNLIPDHEIQCNREALIGAVLNLVNNAIQACADREQETCVHITIEQCHHWLELAVIDNGSGMDDATQQKIAQPFFTTKSQGTGLGLSVVQAVARAHQGEFQLDSQMGEGTTALLRIPLLLKEQKDNAETGGDSDGKDKQSYEDVA